MVVKVEAAYGLSEPVGALGSRLRGLPARELEALLTPDLAQAEDSPLLPLVASTLEALVELNEHKEALAMQTASPDQAPRLTVFHGLRAPPITIEAYLLRIAKYAKCSPACFVAALGYMRRLAALDACYAPTTLNVHRLLLTGVLLAAKFLDDRYYNNAFYAKVGGISTLELNRLELEMLKLLDFRLATTGEGVALLLAQLHSGSYVLDGPAAGCHMSGALGIESAAVVDPVAIAAASAGTAFSRQVVAHKGSAAFIAAAAGGEHINRKRRSLGVEDIGRARLQRRSMEMVQQPEA